MGTLLDITRATPVDAGLDTALDTAIDTALTDPVSPTPAANGLAKWAHPGITARGERRGRVAWDGLKTLWFNTGSLCNIECAGCYIASGPKADHFVYLTPSDVAPYLDEVDALSPAPIEIAFTGGEPTMNPHFIRLSEMALERGHSLLVLTNAMRPMMRPKVKSGLLDLHRRFPGKLTLRVSLDHFTAELHDRERGAGAFAKGCEGLDWLTAQGFQTTIAGRAAMSESVPHAREGFRDLIAEHGWRVDADDGAALVLFPEMDATQDTPEITEHCWGLLGLDPASLMCASSRMVVRRKGAGAPAVLACTLLWDDAQFELAHTLTESLRPVSLNHSHCSQFCVLGGASCSG